MKVAISIFGDRISPRFDVCPEVWVIEVKDGEVIGKEKIPTANLNLTQRLDQITSNGVDKVICGGIDEFSLRQLGNKGVDVVHDVMGEAEVAFDLFMRGRLRSGFCCEKRGGRGLCGWRRGFRGRRRI
jgi:predicted Fe-Mo cluster-binding NifX family protein